MCVYFMQQTAYERRISDWSADVCSSDLLRDASLRDLRGQIGVVTQETMLFDETIFENIRYGKPSATHAEIEAAARRARVLDFVEEQIGRGSCRERVWPYG